ncbi:MAG: flagellar basal body rod protein FlgB [Legionellaceae bacterium]|nr:flagellar basal body rod protein FlgB [Legionellaceae bacterium]
MGINLHHYLSLHANALQLRDQRASQIANNLANTNTPNYKARDIDFKSSLQSALQGSAQATVTTDAKHIAMGTDFASQLKYRVPAHSALDGNTVDKDMETAAYTKNALEYQASLSFLDNKIKMMMHALRGE